MVADLVTLPWELWCVYFLRRAEAGSSHVYQSAERPVTFTVVGINLFWLLLIAGFMVTTGKPATLAGVAPADVPIVGLVWWLKAGAA